MAQDQSSTLTFCEDYIGVAGSVLDLAYWFVVAALVLGIAYGIAELFKKPQVPGPKVQSSLKDLIDALKGLIQAVASAPAWIALFAFGLVLFWAAASIPPECEDEMNQPYATAKTDAAQKAPKPPPDSNASREGDGSTPRERSGT